MDNKIMDDRVTIPFFAHEADMNRLERTNVRLWILCVILILSLIGTNVAWVLYEQQFEPFTVTQQNDKGYNSFIGNDGDIYNGYTND